MIKKKASRHRPCHHVEPRRPEMPCRFRFGTSLACNWEYKVAFVPLFAVEEDYCTSFSSSHLHQYTKTYKLFILYTSLVYFIMANKLNSSLLVETGSQHNGSTTVYHNDTSPNVHQTQYVIQRFVPRLNNILNCTMQGLTLRHAAESPQMLALTYRRRFLRIRQCSIGTFAKLDGLSYQYMRYSLETTHKVELRNKVACPLL